MSEQRAPYYPNVKLIATETRFGAVETNNPSLYDKPLENKVIVKVDILDILRDYWGETILMSRDKVYRLVSGSISDEGYRKLLCSYYMKYSGFCNYVTDKYIFGDKNIPLIRRIVEPARDIISLHKTEVCSELKASGGKYLMETHDYIYYAFSASSSIPEVRGMTVIC